jgi:hypothetical protein
VKAPARGALKRPVQADRMVHPAVRITIGVALALLFSVGMALGRRSNALDQATAYSLAISATLVVSPLAWGHYYMALAPAVLCVPLWLTRRGMPKLAVFFAAIPPVLSWSYYLAMPYLGEMGLLGLGTAVWFMGACALILFIEIFSPGQASTSGSRSDLAQANVYQPHGAGGRPRRTWRRAASHGYSAQDPRSAA